MKALALAAAVTLLAGSPAALAQSAPPAEHDHNHGAATGTPGTTAAPPGPAQPADRGTQGMQGMGGMDMQHMEMMQPTAANPFPPSEMQMHMAMMHATGSTVDETFVRKMIEHHRGAIEMARIEAAKGKDAQARRIAAQNIAEQKKGIASLQAWLRQHGKAAQ